MPHRSQNGLGLYDGLSDALDQFLTWGLPYLFGRLYFGDPEGLRFFAVAMVIGGLSYVLPCLYEIRMSPTFMRKIYGMGSYQGTRLGGFRPNVFFRTGLELGMWMTAASLAGWWLWRCGAIKKIGQFPFGSVLLPILMGTTILCRSTGALALLACGMMLLWFSARFRTRLLLASLLFVGALYVTVRVTNLWSGQQAVDLAESVGWPGSCGVAGISLHVREPAHHQSCRAAGLRMGRVGRSESISMRTRHGQKGPDRRAVDHLPGDQGIRRPDPVLPGPDLAGGLVRPAISSAAMG